MARRTLWSAFRRFNRRYFGNKVKLSGLRYARTKFAGQTTFFDICPPIIEIERGLRGHHRMSCIVLLHEMIHASLPYSIDHGPRFKREVKRLFKLGAYDDLL
jgi:hypothetical protein